MIDLCSRCFGNLEVRHLTPSGVGGVPEKVYLRACGEVRVSQLCDKGEKTILRKANKRDKRQHVQLRNPECLEHGGERHHAQILQCHEALDPYSKVVRAFTVANNGQNGRLGMELRESSLFSKRLSLPAAQSHWPRT